jgi:hypothetical protein
MLGVAGAACSTGATIPVQPNPTETTAESATAATSTPAAPSTTTTGVTSTTVVDIATTQPATASTAGVVIAVDGDLSAVAAFTMLLDDGSTLQLVPAAGLLFDDSGPLSHIRDHLVSGSPVLVKFHPEGDLLIATAVGDAE